MKKEPNLLFDEPIESPGIPWLAYILGSMAVHIVAVIGLSMLTSFFPKNNQQQQVLVPVDVVTLKTKDTQKNTANKQIANRNILPNTNKSTKLVDSELRPETYVIKPPESIPTFSDLEIPPYQNPTRNYNKPIPSLPKNINSANINSASIPESKGIKSIPDKWNININGTKRSQTELFNSKLNDNFGQRGEKKTLGTGSKYPQIMSQNNQITMGTNGGQKTGNINYGSKIPANLFPIPYLKNNQNTPDNNSLNNPSDINANPQPKLPPSGIINSNQNQKNSKIIVNNPLNINSQIPGAKGINIPIIKTRNVSGNKKNQLPAKIAGLLPDDNAPNLTVSIKKVPKQSVRLNKTESNKSKSTNTTGVLIANLIDHRFANNGKDIPDSPAIPRQKQLIDTDDATQSLLGNGGEVLLKIKLLIDTKGRASVVQSPQVLKGVVKGNPDQLVRNIMENWQFEPAKQRGQSVESLLEVTIQLKTNSQ